MRFYMAPLEEVTGYIYRNAYHEFFYPMDKYFAPFIAAKPNKGRLFNYKEKNDILPEHNQDIPLVPQILTNSSVDFIRTAKGLKEYGYKEVNLNLGCPSKPVVNGGRGSGFLAQREKLRIFLDEIFEKTDLKISIKTRLGRYKPEEAEALMDLFNRYPLTELVIHSRIQTDYYSGEPRLEAFSRAYEKRSRPLYYNGDLFEPEDFEVVSRRFPELGGVMLGRGILADPGLCGRIHGEAPPGWDTWKAFHQRLYDDFRRISVNDEKALFKMKELWCYLRFSFPAYDVWNNGIKKAQNLVEYERAVNRLFGEYPGMPGGTYKS
jgi:tRNA-dihydrouridine synthase